MGHEVPEEHDEALPPEEPLPHPHDDPVTADRSPADEQRGSLFHRGFRQSTAGSGSSSLRYPSRAGNAAPIHFSPMLDHLEGRPQGVLRRTNIGMSD